MVDVGDTCICPRCKAGLRAGTQQWPKKVKQHTSRSRRILSRSNLQFAIASSSYFALKRRENGLLLPHLTIRFWIAATVLELEDQSVNHPERGISTQLTSYIAQSLSKKIGLPHPPADQGPDRPQRKLILAGRSWLYQPSSPTHVSRRSSSGS